MSLLLSDAQVPRVRVVANTVEIPQSLFVEKTGMIPEIRTAQGPQTSESLSTKTTVAGKINHETVVQGVAQKIEMDSFIDDLSTVDSKGSSHQDCEGLSHVGKQSGSMQQQQHQDSNQQQYRRHATQEKKGERRKGMVKEERRRKEGKPKTQSTSRSRRT